MIRAVYDHANEAVGVDAAPSKAFEAGEDTRAMIEILAAVVAKANCIAAEAIDTWDADEDRKKQLLDHFASLKEHMLNDLLEQLPPHTAQETPRR